MRLRWPAAWAPAAKPCDCGDGTGSTPGGDVLCPPPSSPLGAGKRRCPSLGALCRRQGLRGQINGRPGGRPMALTSSARLSARASRLGPSNSGAGGPGCASLWRLVYEKLAHTFRLDRERPQDLSGFQARLSGSERASALEPFLLCNWLLRMCIHSRTRRLLRRRLLRSYPVNRTANESRSERL